MYISRFFIKSAPPSFNSLDFFTYTSCHSLSLLWLLSLWCSSTTPPLYRPFMNGIWMGFGTDLQRTWNGPETDLLYTGISTLTSVRRIWAILLRFGSKLLFTDNNYQSAQSFQDFIFKTYWNKIGKIGNLRSLLSFAKNFCQFSIGDAFILNYSLKLIKLKQVVEFTLH